MSAKNKIIDNIVINSLSRIYSLRFFIITLIYSFILISAVTLAFLLRFDFGVTSFKYFSAETLIVVLITKLLMLVAFGQFKALLTFFHMPDLMRISAAMLFSSAIIVVYNHFHFIMPRGVIVADFVLSCIFLCSFRMSLRMLREMGYKALNSDCVPCRNVAILGAGDTGTSIASNLLSHRNLGLRPVIFLDDDKSKQGRQIIGLNVSAVPKNFSDLKNSYDVHKLIIASKTIQPNRIKEIVALAQKAGMDTSIVPSTVDLADGIFKVSQIREVDVIDILGREPVKLDSDLIDEMIKGKVIMVTGAGGSIGAELCRQIAAKNPTRLVILDQCEVLLFQIEQDLIDRQLGILIKSVVADVSNRERIRRIIEFVKPDIIFHAAAHKHVPLMENQPSEALHNNSLGTWILAEEASLAGIEKFVLISTDKAINPTNVMGATKRLSEMLSLGVQSMPSNKTKFAAVRFGNVLGSSGSVIPTFKKQIANGGPLTVTHPDVTRYFMTIPEAVGLVLQCGAQTKGGDIFVLNMGQPVKVIDIARQIIMLSGFKPDIDIEIKITGLRPGEKLYEELQHKDESLVETSHPRIYSFISDPLTYEQAHSIADEISQILNKSSVSDVKKFIQEKVPEYNPQFFD